VAQPTLRLPEERSFIYELKGVSTEHIGPQFRDKDNKSVFPGSPPPVE
jgi:hypothetical protein